MGLMSFAFLFYVRFFSIEIYAVYMYTMIITTVMPAMDPSDATLMCKTRPEVLRT